MALTHGPRRFESNKVILADCLAFKYMDNEDDTHWAVSRSAMDRS